MIASIGHDEITDYLGLELGAYRYWTYCGDLCITTYIVLLVYYR